MITDQGPAALAAYRAGWDECARRGHPSLRRDDYNAVFEPFRAEHGSNEVDFWNGWIDSWQRGQPRILSVSLSFHKQRRIYRP